MSSPTPPAPASLAGKNVLVMGLGHFGGGLGAARWLAAQGAHVTVTDMAPAEKLAEPVKSLAGLPITFKLGGHDLHDLDHADLLVINPAVDRAKSDFVKAAVERDIPTTTEINLFLQRCPAVTVGITGSVGKSTTTALIYEALKAAVGQTSDEPSQSSIRIFLGGNIGRSLLQELPNIRPSDIVVLELSSFMLEETPVIAWSPPIAVVTNIFPNHLDRHGTMAAYTAAKQNILRFQKPTDIAILNNDHDLVARWVHLARGKVAKFTTRGPWAPGGKSSIPLAIPGPHNQSNAAAALAVVGALRAELHNQPHAASIDFPAAIAAIQTFPGLSHRLQLVHTLPMSGGRTLRFFNDSKATTPDASLTAVEAFAPCTAVFIIGGYDKGLAPETFAPFLHALARRASGVLAIGQTGQGLLAQLKQISDSAAVPRVAYAENLESAVRLAADWAQDTPIEALVLSPASASWDQFPNYERRGEQFAALARQLTI